MMRKTNKHGTLWAALGLVVMISGCSRDVRLTGKKLRSVNIQDVEHYGKTLNAPATPQDVTYVLLRAIHDDALAKSPQERENALDVQFDICAANAIQAKNRTMLSAEEFLFRIVNHWTPTVSHYAQDFPTDWEQAKSRMVVSYSEAGSQDSSSADDCHVLIEVADPSGDPAASVVLAANLVKDKGYWRVVHLLFDAGRRTLGD